MPIVNEEVQLVTCDGNYVTGTVISVTPPSKVFTVRMKTRRHDRKIEFNFADYNRTVIPIKKGA